MATASVVGALVRQSIWRITTSSPTRSRALLLPQRAFASKAASKPGKPIVLEQPTKFNPPSHGSRLPRKQIPRHYGGSLSDSELRAQSQRSYPTMLPPEGTWAHWFWTNSTIHVVITLGGLVLLGIFTFALDFTHTSPFKDLIPPFSQLFSEPVQFFSTWMHVIRLHENDRNQKVIEQRARKLDDVIKRRAFQKAHGIDPSPLSKYVPVETKPDAQITSELESNTTETAEPPRRKWFGIF